MFTDASSRAYGAAVYTVNDTCTPSNLLMGKARVAPCREDRLTIPKLELTASLIGARLIHYVTNLFKFQTIYLWSDSKVVISWITSDRDIKDVYIANRVAEIKTLINWHQVKVMYVPTKDNPADYLSRGCTSKQLKSSNWLHGPSWLLTREFPEQTNTNIVVNELTVEINPLFRQNTYLQNKKHTLTCQGGVGCYRSKYQPGSTLEGVGETPPTPSTAAQLSFFAQPRLSKHLSLRGGLPSSSASLCLRFGGWTGPSLGLLI